jgi:hypothetical protein
MSGVYRDGLLAATSAKSRVPGSSDLVKSVLTDFPYPKTTGDNDVDYTVSADFSLSPYPSDPWKFDWTTNPGRTQALYAEPLFYRAGDINYWSRSPLTLGGNGSSLLDPGQDYLICYWLARQVNAIGAND